MSKFPVEYNDQDSNAVVDAVNYVLSGPSGLGQNFSGFSNYNSVYLTGNYRQPFTTFSVSVNSLGGKGTTSLTVDDTANIVIGYYVSGPGIGTKTVAGVTVLAQVTAIDTVNNIITLDTANTGSVSDLITFAPVQSAAIYVAPITIASVTWLGPVTVQVTFATAQPTPPFALGNTPTIAGNSKTQYNTTYIGPGVTFCSTTSCTIRTVSGNNIPVNPGVGTGGTISFSNTLQPPVPPNLPTPDIQGNFNNWVQTDCQGIATITGPTDRAFVSAQVKQTLSYLATASSNLRVIVAINRYTARNISTVANPQLRYTYDATVAERVYEFSGLTGSGIISTPIESVFATFIDQPPPGSYIYRLEFLFRVINDGGALQVIQDKIDVRTLSCQVVKQ